MRRITSLLATLALTLSLTAGPAHAQGRVNMAQALDSLDFLALYVARHFDFFKEEGVDLNLILMSGGGGPNLQAVISGNAEFTPSGVFTVMGAVRRGQPLLMVRTLFDGLAASVVLRPDVASRIGLKPDTPLEEKYRKMRGLTFGVTRPGSLVDQTLRYIIAKAGWKVGQDVSITGVGSGPAALVALEQRKVDGIIHISPVPEQAVSRGTGVMFLNIAAGEVPELGDFLGLALVTTRKYAAEHPEVVRAMNRAITKASKWVLAHRPEETAGVLMKYLPGIEKPILVEVVGANLRAISESGRIREKSVEFPQRMQVEAGLAGKVYPMSEIATNEYLQ